MPNILVLLDASSQTHEVVLLERIGKHLQLRTPNSITPGTAAQLKLAGELLLGEAATSVNQDDHCEVSMQACEDLRETWNRGAAWSALDTEESVAGSLIALNANLIFHDMQWRVNSNRVLDSERNRAGTP